MKRHLLGPQEHYAVRRLLRWRGPVSASVGTLLVMLTFVTWISLGGTTPASERIATAESERAIADSVMKHHWVADSAERARQRRPSDAELRAKAKSRLAGVGIPIAPAPRAPAAETTRAADARPSAPEAAAPTPVATTPDSQSSSVQAEAPDTVVIVRGARWTGRVRPTANLPRVVPNGKLVVAPNNQMRYMTLPGGGTLLLWPTSRFTFSLDSAPMMLGMLIGDMALFVPEREQWRIHTVGGTFTLGTGRYAVRNWEAATGVEITIDSGAVYVPGDSVVGTKLFALVTGEPPTIQRVSGLGFPVVPRAQSTAGGDRAPPLITRGATILLRAQGEFIFSADSARVMKGVLRGEMVLSVPQWSSWQIQTVTGTVTLVGGRYAVRGSAGDGATWISVDSGGVYVPGDSVVGNGLFVRVTREPLRLERAEDGRQFPALPP